MVTIAMIQSKLLEKIEQKDGAKGLRPNKLTQWLTDFDRDKDGYMFLDEFEQALTNYGSPTTKQETKFLFDFWDTGAGQQEARGAVPIELIVQDLLESRPEYGTGFNSGSDGLKANKGAKGNLPSQAGGIFGGGSYEADAQLAKGGPPPQMPAYAQPTQPTHDPAAPAQRPRGNQSSIVGGIFGEGPPAAPASNRATSNRSNQSSISGGIFGEAGPGAPATNKSSNKSNQSSIPGGIFG